LDELHRTIEFLIVAQHATQLQETTEPRQT